MKKRNLDRVYEEHTRSMSMLAHGTREACKCVHWTEFVMPQETYESVHHTISMCMHGFLGQELYNGAQQAYNVWVHGAHKAYMCGYTRATFNISICVVIHGALKAYELYTCMCVDTFGKRIIYGWPGIHGVQKAYMCARDYGEHTQKSYYMSGYTRSTVSIHIRRAKEAYICGKALGTRGTYICVGTWGT